MEETVINEAGINFYFLISSFYVCNFLMMID